MTIVSEAIYFEKPGVQNTDIVLQTSYRRAQQLNIKKILLASMTGDTAVKAVNLFDGITVVVVTLSTGLYEENVQMFTEYNRKIVEDKGGVLLTAAHVFGGLTRSMHQSYIKVAPFTYSVGDIVANTLRIFGQGMKVVCEITAMAADAGLARTDEDVIALAGTSTVGRGVDTAVVIQPANTHNVFDMRIKEILCKPYSW